MQKNRLLCLLRAGGTASKALPGFQLPTFLSILKAPLDVHPWVLWSFDPLAAGVREVEEELLIQCLPKHFRPKKKPLNQTIDLGDPWRIMLEDFAQLFIPSNRVWY